jgi:hypothetical protein
MVITQDRKNGMVICYYCGDSASTTANGHHVCDDCHQTCLKARDKQSDKTTDWRSDLDRFCLGIGRRLQLAKSQVSEAKDTLAKATDGQATA